MAEIFGCCASYMMCSAIGKCIHEESEYQGCQYRRNLEAGRIFYGENAGNVTEPKGNTVEPKSFSAEFLKRYEKYNLYLVCYKQPFAIYSFNKIWSHDLTEDQRELLEALFEDRGIPNTRDYSGLDLLDPQEICDSRVIFEFAGEKFNIISYHNRLIPNWTAEKISKALQGKGLTAKVECFHHKPYEPPDMKPVVRYITVLVDKSNIVSEPIKPVAYEQVNMFEMLRRVI